MSDVQRVLDLGAGFDSRAKMMFPDAEVITVDLNEDSNPDVVADVRALPEDIGQFDTIIASHVLEHIYRLEILPTLKHWYEHTKPGGTLMVAVPDIYWAAEQIISETKDYMGWLLHLYGSGGDSGLLSHRMGFTIKFLRDVVTLAGFTVTEARLTPYELIPGDGRKPILAQQIVVGSMRPRGS